MITFHVESWASYYADPWREALWREHYAELKPAHDGQMAMSPDLAAYQAMETSGQLQIIVARDAGRMVGYSLFLIRRHLHYSALCAFEDSYFLTMDSRQGLAGYRLIRATLLAIWQRGCVRAYFMTKEFASIATLLERLGGKKMDSVYRFLAPGYVPEKEN